MSRTISLHCWVIGTPSKQSFTVKVEHDGDWDSVKDAIKEKKKNDFADIDADTLDLWKVTIGRSQRSNLESEVFLNEVTAKEPLDPIGPMSADLNDSLSEDDIHIIIVKRPTPAGGPDVKGKRKAEAEPDTADHEQRQRDVGAPDVSKRLKIDQGWEDRRLPSEATLQNYHNMLQHVSDDPQWYSNPQNCQFIPFPFRYPEPPERFAIQDGKFEYMGREQFQGVHETVSLLKTGGGGTRLYIQGTMGYGKSHILAALACLFYRQKKVVVFIPDTRALMLDPIPYVKSALLCTFADPSFKEERKWIRACESMDDISSFYHGFQSFPYLIVDQINALESSDLNLNTDSITRERKDACRDFIDKLSVGSYTITSASANYQTAMHMEKKQTNESKLPLIGGMTTGEMEQWWHHHENNLPKFESDEERIDVEELTGCIPLLLRPLLQFSQQKYCEVEGDFWASPEIAAVQQNIAKFSESKGSIGERQYNDYIETLCSCITRGGIFEHPSNSFDHRYFYRDGHNCNYTCGLAREAATSVIAQRKHGKFYEAEWINSLRFYKNNPSALGNQVELICLSCIADMGLNFGDVHIKSKVPRIFVGNLNSLLDIIPSNPELGFSQLYLPENSRFEDIDGLHIRYDHQTNTVHVVPIQVTINPRHKDSEALFYNKWAKWELKFSEYNLISTFTWIVETQIGWEKIMKETRQTRNTTQLITPEHKQAIIPLINVHEPLAKELARIRKGAH